MTVRRQWHEVNRNHLEAAAVELYRQGKVTHYQLSQRLGLSRDETDGVLKEHHVTEDSPTLAEMHAELDFLDQRRRG